MSAHTQARVSLRNAAPEFQEREHQRKSCSLFVVESDVGKLLSAGPVDWIFEAGVVGVQLVAVRQDLIGEVVQLLNVNGIPWGATCKTYRVFACLKEPNLELFKRKLAILAFFCYKALSPTRIAYPPPIISHRNK